MFVLALSLILTVAPPSSTELKTICEVGSVAMRDLPNVNLNKKYDAYYVAPDPRSRDLLTICPELKDVIPQGYPIADDNARSRAAVRVPISGQSVREAFIYTVGVPELSGDLKSAVVHFSYSCTGLCGAELEARYVRGQKGWQRDGAVRLLSVS